MSHGKVKDTKANNILLTKRKCYLFCLKLKFLHLHLKFIYILDFQIKKSDIDNPVKPILDIMQKKYNFNDSDIYALNLKKSIVSKGNEFIEFEIKIKES
jgi:Holliday junction resolvase RusA-like endonuclease